MEGRIDILRLYSKDISRELTIREISKQIGKSYAYTNGIVWDMIKEDIINSRNIGKAIVCSINIKNKMTQELLSFMSFVDNKDKWESSCDDNVLFAFYFGKKLYAVVLGDSVVKAQKMSVLEFNSFVDKNGINFDVVYGSQKYWEKIGYIYGLE